jgi:hypothetical protein
MKTPSAENGGFAWVELLAEEPTVEERKELTTRNNVHAVRIARYWLKRASSSSGTVKLAV